MLVEVELENREENAYNASLWLHLPGNLHFSSLVLQVQPGGGPQIPEETLQTPPPTGVKMESRVFLENLRVVLVAAPFRVGWVGARWVPKLI